SGSEPCVPPFRRGSGCIIGRKTQNAQILEAYVSPGNYYVYLYQTIQSITSNNCFVFEYQMKISFVDRRDLFAKCDSPALPINIDAPGYLDDGYVHIADTFTWTGNSSTTFTVNERSIFRISAVGDQIGDLVLRNSSHEFGKQMVISNRIS